MFKNFSAISFCLAVMFAFSACNDPKPKEAKLKYVISDSVVKTLTIDSVMNCPVVNSLKLTGKVSFNEEKVGRIFPMVSGVIKGVTAQLGDFVQKGQRLGIIKSGEMAGYGSDLITSKTNELIAQKNMNAANDMYKSGLMSEKDYINAQQLYKQSQAQYNRSSQVLQINGGNTQGEFVVKAPISGFIVEKQVNNNMAIRNDNNSNLFTISDLKNIWVIANVYESNITQVHVGDAAEVTTLSYPGRVFNGKIDQVLNVLDPTNKVMKIRVVLPNDDYALKPEMFASVNVISQKGSDALCVPSSALIFDQSEYFILVYKSSSDVRVVPVKKISTNADKTYITGGVNAGDRVIASDAILIYQAMNN